jgi:hypothetical protein
VSGFALEGPELFDLLEQLVGHARQGRGRIRVLSLERDTALAGEWGGVQVFAPGHATITVQFSGIPPGEPALSDEQKAI